MGKQIKDYQKRTNPILWFLFAIVIPIIVAGILTIIVLNIAGVNVSGWAKETGSKIPVVSTFITTDKEKDIQETIDKAQAKVADQEIELKDLNQHVTDLEETIELLEREVIKLENSNREVDAPIEDDQGIVAIKSMAASFKKMNKKQAALIFQELDDEKAIAMLKELPNDVRGGILESMDPKTAAKLTNNLINSED